MKSRIFFIEACKRIFREIKSKEKPAFDLNAFYAIVNKCDNELQTQKDKLYWIRWQGINSYLDSCIMSPADLQWYEENKIELRFIARQPSDSN